MPPRILVVDDSPTIRRVVSAILERHGYEAALAADGQEAMDALTSGDVNADLVLLDFVMPRMNGYQFCRALRGDAELATTPVILMSAKADRIRDQFVQQTGAIDAITKPFDAQALVAVIENALRRVSTRERASSAVHLPDFDPEEKTSEVVQFETRRTQLAGIVAQKLASVVAKVLETRPRATNSELVEVLAARLETDVAAEMVEAVRDLDASASGPILSGDLGIVPIGAILQLLQAENQTGVLVCRGPNAQITATFRGGLIDLVQSSGAGDEFRLGRFFVEEGIVSPAEIDEVLRACEGAGEPLPPSSVHVKPSPDSEPTLSPARAQALDAREGLLATALLEAKKITAAELRSALERQSSELLYEVLRWPKGRFEFRRDPPLEIDGAARLGMPVAAVVLEGFRRVEEWRALEKTLGAFDVVPIRDDDAFGALDASRLPDREKKILDLVDGERSVRQIVAASHMSSFDACRILVQFLEARVLRPRA